MHLVLIPSKNRTFPSLNFSWAYVYLLRDLSQPLLKLEVATWLCMSPWKAGESDRHISQVTVWKIKASCPWPFFSTTLPTALLSGGKCQQLEQSLWTKQGSHMWKIKEPTHLLGTAPNRLLWEKCKLLISVTDGGWGRAGLSVKDPTYILTNAHTSQI